MPDHVDGEIEKHRSFIASVNLRAAVEWSGRIRAYWDTAKASSKSPANVLSSITADKYTVVLKKIGGNLAHLEFRKQ